MKIVEDSLLDSRCLASLKTKIRKLMTENSIPGLSVSVIHDGKIYFREYFGVRNVHTKEVLTPGTVFEANSFSKPLFAYGVMKLCESGVLDLDRSILEYGIDKSKYKNSCFEYLTIRNLLSHTSGLPNFPMDDANPGKVYFSPGTRFSYSCLGYILLQEILESVTGRSAEHHIKKYVFSPFCMSNSSYIWTGKEKHIFAHGHCKNSQPIRKRKYLEMNAAYSLHTTIEDFTNFMIANMQLGVDIYLSSDSMNEMLRAHIQVNDDSNSWKKDWPKESVKLSKHISWGLGWGIQHRGDGNHFWQWGTGEGFRSFCIGNRTKEDGVVMLSNSENASNIWGRLLIELVGGCHPSIDWLKYPL